MGITHGNVQNYNAHTLDTVNAQNRILNIRKIHNKPVVYNACKGIICAISHRSKMV
jgi:hypothetical protein